MADKRGDSFARSVKLALTAVLVSPDFVYRVELGPKGDGEFRLNDYQLASRLSYFLWASMPDDELFTLAADGKLTDRNVLHAQVKRMLLDPSRAHSHGHLPVNGLVSARLAKPLALI